MLQAAAQIQDSLFTAVSRVDQGFGRRDQVEIRHQLCFVVRSCRNQVAGAELFQPFGRAIRRYGPTGPFQASGNIAAAYSATIGTSRRRTAPNDALSQPEAAAAAPPMITIRIDSGAFVLRKAPTPRPISPATERRLNGRLTVTT